MNKLIYIIFSLLIFLIIDPLFNGIFTYLLININNYYRSYFAFNFKEFTFIISIAYITTFIPATVIGILYGVLAAKRKRAILLWLIPLLGAIVYLIYAFIFEMMTHFWGNNIIYISLIVALLSLGATFVSTLISNIILKGKTL